MAANNSRRIHKEQGIDITGRSIEVVVGSVTFSVHENLICTSSDFFKKAMNGKWKESKERSVQLEWDDPKSFQLYIHWVYYHALLTRVDDPGNEEYIQLANAYILGDMLLDKDFKDAITDAMIHKSNSVASDGKKWYPVGPVIPCIYNNTLESSKARRLLVDLYVRHGSGSWLCDWSNKEEVPKDFLFDLAVALLNKRSRPSKEDTTSKPCEYHEHGPEATLCYRDRLVNCLQALQK